MKKITSTIAVAIVVPTLLSGCVLSDLVRQNEMSLSTPERKALAERRAAERTAGIRTASLDAPAPVPSPTIAATRSTAEERRPVRTASAQRREPERTAPAQDASTSAAAPPETTVRPRVAGGDRLMGALMRSWNRIAAPNASSKDLFGVWPEELDGRSPTVTELQKRSSRT